MIFDTFMFFNELDILEIRLNTLYDYVDKFILVECDKTFSGNPKPLYFQENRDRFSEFSDKIIHTVYKYNDNISVWDNEHAQRNHAETIVREIHKSENDILLVSDLDEIFNPTVIERYLKGNIEAPWHCGQTIYLYYLNVRNKRKIDHWKLPVIMKYKNLKKNLTDIRLEKPYRGVFNKGGWHFTYMGGNDKIKYKIQSFAHQELNNEDFLNTLNRRVRKLLDHRGARYKIVPIDDSFPLYVQKNINKLIEKGLILVKKD